MMRDEFYHDIASKITMTTSRKALQALMSEYKDENITFDTFMAIYSQKMSEMVKNDHGIHSKQAWTYASKYRDQKMAFVEIAEEVHYSPVNIAKAVIGKIHEWLSKDQLKGWIKDPSLITAENDVEEVQEGSDRRRGPLQKFSPEYYARLRQEVSRAILQDTINSPLIDRTKQYIGIEYELILREKLMNLNISFQDEADLAEKGFKRTPDVLLDVPIQVNGHTVLWIDSKACFGDRTTHENNRAQFESYRSVFGSPGLVIYWFGFVASLNDGASEPSFVMDHFPEPHEIVRISTSLDNT